MKDKERIMNRYMVVKGDKGIVFIADKIRDCENSLRFHDKDGNLLAVYKLDWDYFYLENEQ